MNVNLNAIVCLIMLIVPGLVLAAGGHSSPELKKAPVNAQDTVSLQRGAQVYLNNCLGCHSLKYMRYERLVSDLDIPEGLVQKHMIFSGASVGSQMVSALSEDLGKTWFGVIPPDLTLEARLKGSDWVYSYLTGFYADESRPWGVNNYYFENVGMPHVLSNMESELGTDKFNETMGDLTNFLAYAADPTKLKRENIGKWVLIFLAIFLIPVWLLNREYWKDVH